MYKLLIVEDDSGIAEGIKEQAEKWGLEVKCAEDFNDVLGEFKRFQPHIVLMDIMLPFYNGYHWCSEIRRISNVPIIFISSASDNMNIVMAMNMGGDDFIAKPVDLSVMMAKIQALLRKFDQLYDAGVRQFGVLGDDVGSLPRTIVINMMTKVSEWAKKKGDVYDTVFCPAGYNHSWQSGLSLIHI